MHRELAEIERLAIWNAHSKRCFYCGEPLEYSELEIDHILPRCLARSPNELKDLIIRLALPPDFSIDSIKNLLPAHRICNSRKRDKVFNEANARYFMEMADKKTRTIEDLIRKLQIEASRERLLTLVRSALQSGSVDLGDILDAASRTAKFPLKSTVEFQSGSWNVSADPERINEMFDEPVKLHFQNEEGGVRFTDGQGSAISVSTCRQYKDAIAKGYYPSDNINLKASFALAEASAILEAASRARLASVSYIRAPRQSVTNLEMLPAALAPMRFSDKDNVVRPSDCGTLQELVESGTFSAEILSDLRVKIECHDRGVVLTELMRADFDEDAVEEILIVAEYYIKFATFRSRSIGLLRKKDAFSLFDYKPWDQEIEMAQHRYQTDRAMR